VGYKREECPTCKRQVVKEKIYEGEDAFLIDGAKKFPDFMQSCTYFIVSERVMNVLRENNVSGFDEAKKVPLYRSRYRKLIKQEQEYYIINITGSIDLNLKAMALKRKHVCPECGSFDWSRQRLYIFDSVFDMNTWDGSDICRIKSFPGYVMISDKLKEIFEEHKFTGATYKKESDIFRL
jgi:predicted RNA-binding Zn-ribbon protein involved in translation (DUF1610 family)